jgi:quercetin 2,3-dioxygenase
VLRTGAGVEHSEVAAAPQTRFVQVWLTAEPEGESSYDVLTPPPGPGLVTVAEVPGGVLRVARLDEGETLAVPRGPRVHVFVARGALVRSSLAEPLRDGDAFLFTDEPALDLTAGVPTELLVWQLA